MHTVDVAEFSRVATPSSYQNNHQAHLTTYHAVISCMCIALARKYSTELELSW